MKHFCNNILLLKHQDVENKQIKKLPLRVLPPLE